MTQSRLSLLLMVGLAGAIDPPPLFTAEDTQPPPEPSPAARHGAAHVWEKVEIQLVAEGKYANPYTDVRVWVDLAGPGFRKRCYGFWDGGKKFSVRVLATAVGEWRWRSDSRPRDSGLAGKSGTFAAFAWTEEEKRANVCRRGLLRPTANGHAFEHSDGASFFLIGDTWWATPTFRFPWHDDDRERPMGPDAGFKDYVRLRREQGYNAIAMIAAFPNWHTDGQPARLADADGTLLRAAWPQRGTSTAKIMTDEAGNRPFRFPGKVPGYENVFPDLERINPEYFRSLDRKIDYLNARGMVPFIEVARRDIGPAWKKYYPWPDSYARYIQYVWSRYQANNCLFSPIHFDTPHNTIPTDDWNVAATRAVEELGKPPFGTLVGLNSNPSSLRNFGHVDRVPWLDFHQIGNRRTHDCYAYLTEIFRTSPPVPAINGEPYYDGMEDAEPGSELAALYCRSALYGSILSGGLGGHIYGAGGWKGGIWSGDVEEGSRDLLWNAILWPSGAQMPHARTFLLSEGDRYRDLVPAEGGVSPNRSGKKDGLTGWAYCARTSSHDLFFVYFERDCPRAVVSGARPRQTYVARWFDPRAGQWHGAEVSLDADPEGKIRLPPFPNGEDTSRADWAIKLVPRED